MSVNPFGSTIFENVDYTGANDDSGEDTDDAAQQTASGAASGASGAQDGPAKKKRPGGKGKRKIAIEYVTDKHKRAVTFSKRKAGIFTKARELATLCGCNIMLLVVSESGVVYNFTTEKFQPMVTQDVGRNMIAACLTGKVDLSSKFMSTPSGPVYRSKEGQQRRGGNIMIKDAYRDDSPAPISPALSSSAKQTEEKSGAEGSVAPSTAAARIVAASQQITTPIGSNGHHAFDPAADSTNHPPSPTSTFYEHFGTRLPPLPPTAEAGSVNAQASGSQPSPYLQGDQIYPQSAQQNQSNYHEDQNKTELLPVPQNRSRSKRARLDEPSGASGLYQSIDLGQNDSILVNGNDNGEDGEGDAVGEDDDGIDSGDISDGECEKRLRHIRRSLSIERRFDKAAEVERPRLVRNNNNSIGNGKGGDSQGGSAGTEYLDGEGEAEMQAEELARAVQEHTARMRETGWSFTAADDAWNNFRDMFYKDPQPQPSEQPGGIGGTSSSWPLSAATGEGWTLQYGNDLHSNHGSDAFNRQSQQYSAPLSANSGGGASKPKQMPALPEL